MNKVTEDKLKHLDIDVDKIANVALNNCDSYDSCMVRETGNYKDCIECSELSLKGELNDERQ